MHAVIALQRGSTFVVVLGAGLGVFTLKLWFTSEPTAKMPYKVGRGGPRGPLISESCGSGVRRNDAPPGQKEAVLRRSEIVALDAGPKQLLYAGANRLTAMRLAELDLPEGNAMRAPGEAPGLMALEMAMDGNGSDRLPHCQRHPSRPGEAEAAVLNASTSALPGARR